MHTPLYLVGLVQLDQAFLLVKITQVSIVALEKQFIDIIVIMQQTFH